MRPQTIGNYPNRGSRQGFPSCPLSFVILSFGNNYHLYKFTTRYSRAWWNFSVNLSICRFIDAKALILVLTGEQGNKTHRLCHRTYFLLWRLCYLVMHTFKSISVKEMIYLNCFQWFQYENVWNNRNVWHAHRGKDWTVEIKKN